MDKRKSVFRQLIESATFDGEELMLVPNMATLTGTEVKVASPRSLRVNPRVRANQQPEKHQVPPGTKKVKLPMILLETDCPDRRLKRHLVEVSLETVQQRRSPTKAKTLITNRPATSERYECILLSHSRSDQLRLPRCLMKWTPRRFAVRV